MYIVHLWRKRNFACSKRMSIPYLDQLFFPVILFLVQTQHFCDSRLPKTKSDAPFLIKLYLPFTSINLINFIRVFVPFLRCHGLWIFFQMFVFVCFSLLSLLLSLFSLVFISGQNFISSSKDVAASTAVVELIIRTITLTIAY